jgi:hypothetical protein
MRVGPIPDPPGVLDLPWYHADHTLPPYRFVPGLYPHPDQNSTGHRVGRTAHDVHPPWQPEQWTALPAYLRGVDLFNRWYFWEAHEAWEPLWRAHRVESGPARFIQGLISVSAALLKRHMQETPAADKLSRAARERLKPFTGVFMGLEVERFRVEWDQYLARPDKETAPALGRTTPRIRLV